MSKVFIEESTLTAIGDAIRTKTGGTEMIPPLDMATAISGITTGDGTGGGGGYVPTDEELTFTGNLQYKFAYDCFDWFIREYGDRITLKNVASCANLFYYSSNKDGLTSIPFDIGVSNSITTFSNMFGTCSYLTSAPYITLPDGVESLPAPTGTYSKQLDMQYMFSSCSRMKEIPYDFFTKFINRAHAEAAMTTGGGNRSNMFSSCYCLRELPDLSTIHNGSTSTPFYYESIKDCRTLNKVRNYPVLKIKATSHMFSSVASGFGSLGRINEFTWETNEDGTPIEVEWANQAVRYFNSVSYGCAGVINKDAHITNYSDYSGITIDKKVTDDASYQALKNDPDWWTTDYAYSRYNHDSAVATINTLPDTSAFLATNGGTNTIVFCADAGSNTDGGAIGNLTEEEIAVAADKGWTISLVTDY